MSISTFNFQFYNYKLPAELPLMPVSSFSELEMDIDDEEMGATTPPITSTPLPLGRQPAATPSPTPRFTSELALAINGPQVEEVRAKPQQPVTKPLQELRPQLHKPQKRWSMELREKILEMSKRNNASSSESLAGSVTDMQQRFMQHLQQHGNEELQKQQQGEEEDDDARSVSEKINFFNKLTNTFESARGSNPTCNSNNTSCNSNNKNNCFISLLRSSRPQGMATTTASQQAAAIGFGIPPPKPKRVGATSSSLSSANIVKDNNGFALPAVPSVQRKCSLRRKPSMEKSRASIARQNSNASLKPQRHAMMEDLSLVVPVRLRIAEYEQRISMSAA